MVADVASGLRQSRHCLNWNKNINKEGKWGKRREGEGEKGKVKRGRGEGGGRERVELPYVVIITKIKRSFRYIWLVV